MVGEVKLKQFAVFIKSSFVPPHHLAPLH